MLAHLARWCYRHRRTVVVAWIVALIVISAAGRQLASFSTSFRASGTESQKAFDLLATKYPSQSGNTGTLVVRADRGVADPSVQASLGSLTTALAAVPGVANVERFDAPEAARQVSKDGTIGYVGLVFRSTGEVDKATIGAVRDAVAKARAPGLQLELAGNQFGDNKPPSSEGIGILCAIVILLIAFGSVLAMGLPILMALFGVGIGLAVVELLTRLVDVQQFTTQIAAMIGIGVGIDYALFIVTRYRQGLHDGLDPEEAVVTAIATAGKAVVFAGMTVVIALLGLLLIGLAFVRGLGLGSSAVVGVSILASITLLPALLGFVGRTIDRLSLPGFAKRQAKPTEQGVWYRWSHHVARRPLPYLALGLVVLLGLATPVLSLRLGSSDAGNDPAGSTTRKAYDLLSEGFGKGFNGPFLVAVEMPKGQADLPTVVGLTKAIGEVPGVASVTPPRPNPAGDAAIFQVFPTTSPQDAKTTTLLHHLRGDVIPQALRGTDVVAHVGGITAVFSDLTELLGSRLPVFIGAVLVLSFLLLLTVFRSVLVPLKAVVMNLLSIGAAYGLLVLVFQKGVGASLLGVTSKGPIESFAPMMLFAILFGLSMDYEVFLLSRVKEEYDRTGDNGAAVADGLTQTARVITAAAAIMVAVFGSFVLGDNRVVKEFGLGLAFAIFIDATLVRMVLVPATMELLGDANWWFPKALERIVPKIHIEGVRDDEAEGDLTDDKVLEPV